MWTKTEIKFEDEQAIWQILMASVREVLGRSNMAPTIDFDVADCPDIPVFTSGNGLPNPPELTVDTNYNPFRQSDGNEYKRSALRWDELYKGVEGSTVGREVRFDVLEVFLMFFILEEEDEASSPLVKLSFHQSDVLHGVCRWLAATIKKSQDIKTATCSLQQALVFRFTDRDISVF